MRKFAVSLALVLVLLGLIVASGTLSPKGLRPAHVTGIDGRTIVLGFDGLDSEPTERWMADGLLPHFSKLRVQGDYQRLATTNPAQSPVSWATFATGLNPGDHGIFDFLETHEVAALCGYSV